jgi:hypothetical protein
MGRRRGLRRRSGLRGREAMLSKALAHCAPRYEMPGVPQPRPRRSLMAQWAGPGHSSDGQLEGALQRAGDITETKRTQLVLFGMRSPTLGPRFVVCLRDPIPSMGMHGFRCVGLVMPGWRLVDSSLLVDPVHAATWEVAECALASSEPLILSVLVVVEADSLLCRYLSLVSVASCIPLRPLVTGQAPDVVFFLLPPCFLFLTIVCL